MACIRSPKCSMAYRSPSSFQTREYLSLDFPPSNFLHLHVHKCRGLRYAEHFSAGKRKNAIRCFMLYAVYQICAHISISFIRVYSMKKARKINLMGSSARVYIKTSFWEQISCVFRTKSIFGARISTCKIMLSLNHPCESSFIESISF